MLKIPSQFFCFLLFVLTVSCEHIPFFVWNNGPELNLDNHLTGAKLADKLYQYGKSNDVKLIFINLPSLSLEDLSVKGPASKESFPNFLTVLDEAQILNSVAEPTRVLKTLQSKPLGKTLNWNDKNFYEDLKENTLSFVPFKESESDMLYLLQGLDSIIGKINKAMAKRKYMLVITGSVPSFDLEQDRHIRSLLAVPVPVTNQSVWFLNDSALFHVREVGDQVLTADDIDGDSSNNTQVIRVQINGQPLEMVFTHAKKVWKLDLEATSYGGQNVSTQYPIEAPLGFSYSCAKIHFKTESSNFTMKGFQVQPFNAKLNDLNKARFESSFDCSPFFTIPVWMGIIVVSILAMILAIGVYALFDINTMDRFDDVNSKQITVPTE